MNLVKTGLDNLIADLPIRLKNNRLGLLSNPASVDRFFSSSRQLIAEAFPNALQVLFTPQHGFYSEKQDNMIESTHLKDPRLGIQVYSLYGEVRKPTDDMLDQIDTLIIDLQDVGTRVYTFIYTMSYCMEACQKNNVRVIVLDRPNPVGGHLIEGNTLDPNFVSFVGRYPIPMRHGMTIGELALFFNEECGINCELSVIPMTGWQRYMYFEDTGLPWVAPSPNLPTAESCKVYPGQVIWEGTNISEARGTTQPFEFFGAPFLDIEKIAQSINVTIEDGYILRPTGFEPTSNKWKGELCKGFQLHVTDKDKFKPYLTSLKLLQAIWINHGDDIKWKNPPYEYEYHKLPIDLIVGDQKVRKGVQDGVSLEVLEEAWQDGLLKFKEISRKYYLYE